MNDKDKPKREEESKELKCCRCNEPNHSSHPFLCRGCLGGLMRAIR